MKKIVLIISVVFITISGCYTKSSELGVSKQRSLSGCMNNAPEWVVYNGLPGGVSGVGSSIINRAGLHYSRIEALSSARDVIGDTILKKVNSTFDIFVNSTGIRVPENFDMITVNVGKQVSAQVIGASKVGDSWVSPCDELFILAVVETDVVKRSLKDNAVAAFRTDNVLWQVFQARKLQYDLEAAIEREFRDGALK